MTISKKLFLLVTLTIGMNTFPYRITKFKKEVILISTFANTLRAEQYPQLANWLESKINQTYLTSNSMIVKIAEIINTSDKPALDLYDLSHKEFLLQEKISLCTGFFCAGIIVGCVITK